MDSIDISPLKRSFSQLKNPEITQKPNFDLPGKEKILSLKKAILELNELIEERKALSNDLIKEAEKLKIEINNYLLENQNNFTPNIDTRDLSREKNDLRYKKMEISELQLNEKVNCWKDISSLKKEKRIYERELNEKVDRASALSKLMEDN
jgi:DNA mismatch repair ATPase MutS